MHLDDFLSPETLRKLREPELDLAKGLPASIYTDSEFFALENERLFHDTWVGIGFDSDVPNTGDAIPIEVGGTPLILCRDNNSCIQVLHNVCRHRATIVLESQASGLKTFKCPYHGWVYGLMVGCLPLPSGMALRAQISVR